MATTPARRAYHHGDLRSSLIDVALELIAEHGPRGFSLAEASRRAGVSVAAPYRHFADRDELMAAVAARGYEALRERMQRAAAAAEAPGEQLALAAAAYVRWAEDERVTFSVLFGAGLDKGRYPWLREAADNAYEVLLTPARRLARPAGTEAASELALAVGVVAHGYAVALGDSMFGPRAEAADATARRAAGAARAMIRGRRLLGMVGS